MSTRLIVDIISQYVQILNNYNVYLKLISYYIYQLCLNLKKKENNHCDKIYSLAHDNNSISLPKV